MQKEFDRKNHWERIYHKRKTDELSWYQPAPTISLEFVENLNLPLNAKIIDVGGGDSLLVDHLLKLGYQDITILDISQKALEKARQRIDDKTRRVKWINADAAEFHPSEKYDLWHDRAAFHFLTDQKEIENYISSVSLGVKTGGYAVIVTFSEQGPEKCSGIEITQYSEQKMTERLGNSFMKTRCLTADHKTPSGTIQNFIYCCFRRMATT